MLYKSLGNYLKVGLGEMFHKKHCRCLGPEELDQVSTVLLEGVRKSLTADMIFEDGRKEITLV